MRVLPKICLLSLVTALTLFSCSPAETTVPSTVLSAVTPVSPVASETPALTAIPKQNDLIFIEFFAGT